MTKASAMTAGTPMRIGRVSSFMMVASLDGEMAGAHAPPGGPLRAVT